MCSRQKPTTLRGYVDCGKAITIDELKKLIRKDYDWFVNTTNNTATCMGVTANLGPIEEDGKNYWAYPNTTCSDTFDITLIEKAASWRRDNHGLTEKSPKWPKHPDHPEGRVLAV
jgi:hypothetical protein